MISAARGLHGAWAVLGFGICLMLIFAGGGHPPPIIFLPVVLAVWVAGHAALGVAGWLARRGARAAAASGRGARWPASLAIAVAGTGLATLLGFVQGVVTLVTREPYAFRGALWPLTMAIWTLHGACLAALLLRKTWALRLAALLSGGWAALMAWQIVDHLWRGRPVDAIELAVAVAIVVGFGGLGVFLFRARP